MARSHHIGKRQQRGDQRVIFTNRQGVECAIRERNSDGFGLRAADSSSLPKKPP